LKARGGGKVFKINDFTNEIKYLKVNDEIIFEAHNMQVNAYLNEEYALKPEICKIKSCHSIVLIMIDSMTACNPCIKCIIC